MNPTILIIDDDNDMRSLLVRIVSKEGYKVFDADDAAAGLKILEREEINVVLSDVNLPDANGVELVQIIKANNPFTEIIVVTGYGSIEGGVQSIKNGAFDYLVKGEDNKKIIPLISKAIDKSQLQYRIHQLEQKVFDKFSFDNIIGSSAAITRSKDLAGKVAQTDASVLLLGETGTGKEVFAQAIHETGKRKLKPFVAVNSSSFGREILESELFGHKAGAFTGATKDKRGLLDEANGGTIFFDEVGEMNIDLQAKLLRVLETQQFHKVGDSKPTKVDVRIIAASNRDLEKEAREGNFRLDLFYRLSVFEIILPPLAERLDDIESISLHFIRMYATRMNKPVPEISKEFSKALTKHPWKGNVRELKNVIERALIICDKTLLPEHLPFEFDSTSLGHPTFDLAVMEKQHIMKVLNHARGNKTEAARLLNIGLTTLYRKLQEYGLEKKEGVNPIT
ncbi:MAG: sigma-54 dependent transcriptional regulator [Bacteroidota bacterium]